VLLIFACAGLLYPLAEQSLLLSLPIGYGILPGPNDREDNAVDDFQAVHHQYECFSGVNVAVYHGVQSLTGWCSQRHLHNTPQFPVVFRRRQYRFELVTKASNCVGNSGIAFVRFYHQHYHRHHQHGCFLVMCITTHLCRFHNLPTPRLSICHCSVNCSG
jgi:hypothetical protein